MPKKLHIDLPNNQQFFSIKELKDMGLSYYGIKKLVMEEKLIKLNNHCYENTLYQGEELDFYYVFAYAPQGVICQMSAAQYYGLTSYWPNEIDVAIERTKKYLHCLNGLSSMLFIILINVLKWELMKFRKEKMFFVYMILKKQS